MKYFSPNEIMDFINSSGLKYEDKGDYIRFKCINPAHDDRNPSMTMLKSNGFARCWACGKVYNFVNLYYVLTGEKIAQRHSSFISSLSKPLVKGQSHKREKVIEYRLEKGALYHPRISPTVSKFLEDIGITKEAIDYFDIRWTDMVKMGFDPKKDTTFIKDRICIPIVEDGKIVNMECRDFTFNQKPKVIYPKGSKAVTLFNYDNLDKNKPLIVVEGVKSALRIWSYISKNVTATLGCSISKGQREKIKEFNNIILFPDNDEAGLSMIKQFEEFYELDYHYTLMKQEGYDPADGSIEDVKEALQNKKPNYTRNLEELFGEGFFQKQIPKWG